MTIGVRRLGSANSVRVQNDMIYVYDMYVIYHDMMNEIISLGDVFLRAIQVLKVPLATLDLK